MHRAKQLPATKNGIPAAVLKALVFQESKWNPSAKSPTGPIGLTQLTKATAEKWGLKTANPDERLDPQKNAEAGAKELKDQFDHFAEAKGKVEQWRFALGAYNRGRAKINAKIKEAGLSGKTDICWNQVAPFLKGKDQEGRDYVRIILGEEPPQKPGGVATTRYGYEGD